MSLKEKLIVDISIQATAEVLSIYQRALKLLVRIDQSRSGVYPGYLASMMASELMGAAVHIYTAADNIPDKEECGTQEVTEQMTLAAMEKANKKIDQDAILAEVTKLLKEQIDRHTENILTTKPTNFTNN